MRATPWPQPREAPPHKGARRPPHAASRARNAPLSKPGPGFAGSHENAAPGEGAAPQGTAQGNRFAAAVQAFKNRVPVSFRIDSPQRRSRTAVFERLLRQGFMFVQRVMAALGWSFALRLAIQIFSWAVTLIVIRLLSPQDYGLMAMAVVYLGLGVVWRELGLNSLIIQARDLSEAELSRIFGAIILAHVLLAALLAGAAPFLAALFGDERLAPVLQVLAFSLLAMTFDSVPRAWLERALDFKATNAADLIAGIASAGVTLTLALLDQGVWSLVAGNVTTAAVASAVLWAKTPLRLRPRFDLWRLSNRFAFAGHSLWSQTLGQALGSMDHFIVGKLMGTSALGIYSIARELGTLPIAKISSVLTVVAFPAVAEIQADPTLIRGYFLRAVRLQATLATPAMFGLAACASEIVPLVLGEQWRAGIFIFAMICLGTPMRMIAVLLPPLAFGRGRPDVTVACQYRSLLVSAAFLSAGIAAGGLDGLAIASLAVALVTTLWSLSLTMPLIGGDAGAVLAEIRAASLNSALMGGVVYGFGLWLAPLVSVPMLLAAKIALGVAVYAALAFALDRDGLALLGQFAAKLRRSGRETEALP
jgi:O-antigen/teichoic acid export membrane protein